MAVCVARPGVAQEQPGAVHRHQEQHGNPADLDAYIARLQDPSRDAWQKPDQVVAALRLEPGQTACDVGSGPGYFSLRLGRAVGSAGRVYAVDVEPRILAALVARLGQARIANVTPVLSLPDDPLLGNAMCDVALIVDTYHHFPDGPAYLKRLTRSLRPGGRIVNVDYQKKPTPVGPPLARRVSREDFLKDAAAAGLRLAQEHTFLPHQYLLVLEPR